MDGSQDPQREENGEVGKLKRGSVSTSWRYAVRAEEHDVEDSEVYPQQQHRRIRSSKSAIIRDVARGVDEVIKFGDSMSEKLFMDVYAPADLCFTLREADS